MVNRPSARISNNQSPTYPHLHTLMLLYLWHWLKNGFLQFEENVNRGTREKERKSEQERGTQGAWNAFRPDFQWTTHSNQPLNCCQFITLRNNDSVVFYIKSRY